MSRLLMIAATAFSLTVGGATAASFKVHEYLNQFDKNEDRLLDRNEIAQMRVSARKSLDDNKLAVLAQIDPLISKYQKLGSIPIFEFKEPIQRVACEDSPIFLRADVTSLPLLSCAGFWPDPIGAGVSLALDNLTGHAAATINGGVGVQLYSGSQFSPAISDVGNSLLLSDLALMAFAEMKGTLSSTGNDTGYARYGLKSEFLFEDDDGKPFDAFGLSLTGYHKSNLQTQQDAWGVQASFVPHIYDLRINSFGKNPNAKRSYYWKVLGVFDYFSQDSNSALTAMGVDHAWIGGQVGFQLVDRSFWENGAKISVTLDAFWDMVNDRDALQLNASMDFNLDPDGRASFGIDYVRGRSRHNLIEQDKIIAGLKFAL